jgi:hypothetical protein
MNKKCLTCAHKRLWEKNDYVITELNRPKAIEEIVKSVGAGKAEIKYMEDLLNDSDGWTKVELEEAVCSFTDGYVTGKAEK